MPLIYWHTYMHTCVTGYRAQQLVKIGRPLVKSVTSLQSTPLECAVNLSQNLLDHMLKWVGKSPVVDLYFELWDKMGVLLINQQCNVYGCKLIRKCVSLLFPAINEVLHRGDIWPSLGQP